MITGNEFVAQVRAFVGSPWQHQGRATCGVDCIGLVLMSLEAAGIDLEQVMGFVDKRDYGRGAQPELLGRVKEYCQAIPSPIDGCLIVMKFPREQYPRHFGIYADGNIIHADARLGHVVEHGYRGVWKRCQHSLWKLPNVSYA